MKLIVCLGNPGKEYEYTRHNVGFLCFDEIVHTLNDSDIFHTDSQKKKKNYEAHIFQKTIHGAQDSVVLLKPLVYMNRSGEAVREFLASYSRPLSSIQDVWILHDDLALPLGTLRVDVNKSAGGHNGIQNIIDHMKTKEFTRFRVGILYHDIQQSSIEEYVLKKFSRKELPVIKNMVTLTAELVIDSLERGIPFVQQKVNRHVFFKCI